jgi:hypothetical protein
MLKLMAWQIQNIGKPSRVIVVLKSKRHQAGNVSEHRVGDTPYFEDLMREIENGGREAFAHYLLTLDVSGFVPLRDTPKNNNAKREMIRRSINPFDARKWLEECCLTQQIIGAVDSQDWSPGKPASWRKWSQGLVVPFHLLANAYTAWQRDVKSPVSPQPTPKGSLGEVLNRAGFEQKRTYKGAERILPDPDLCLDRLFRPPSETDHDNPLP